MFLHQNVQKWAEQPMTTRFTKVCVFSPDSNFFQPKSVRFLATATGHERQLLSTRKAGLPADGLAFLWQSFNISCCYGKWQSLIGKPSPYLPFSIAIGYVRLRVPFDKPALFNLTWCDMYIICMKSAAELTTCATCRCSLRPYLRRSTGRALLVMLLGTCPNDIGERRL
jgi:hypothetical protein